MANPNPDHAHLWDGWFLYFRRAYHTLFSEEYNPPEDPRRTIFAAPEYTRAVISIRQHGLARRYNGLLSPCITEAVNRSALKIQRTHISSVFDTLGQELDILAAKLHCLEIPFTYVHGATNNDPNFRYRPVVNLGVVLVKFFTRVISEPQVSKKIAGHFRLKMDIIRGRVNSVQSLETEITHFSSCLLRNKLIERMIAAGAPRKSVMEPIRRTIEQSYSSSFSKAILNQARYFFDDINRDDRGQNGHPGGIRFLIWLHELCREEQHKFNNFPGESRYCSIPKAVSAALYFNEGQLLGRLMLKPSFGVMHCINNNQSLIAVTLLRFIYSLTGTGTESMADVLLSELDVNHGPFSKIRSALNPLLTPVDNETFFRYVVKLMKQWDEQIARLCIDLEAVSFDNDTFITFMRREISNYNNGGRLATIAAIRGTRTWERGYFKTPIPTELKDNDLFCMIMEYITSWVPEDICFNVHYAILENATKIREEDISMVQRYNHILPEPDEYDMMKKRFLKRLMELSINLTEEKKAAETINQLEYNEFAQFAKGILKLLKYIPNDGRVVVDGTDVQSNVAFVRSLFMKYGEKVSPITLPEHTVEFMKEVQKRLNAESETRTKLCWAPKRMTADVWMRLPGCGKDIKLINVPIISFTILMQFNNGGEKNLRDLCTSTNCTEEVILYFADDLCSKYNLLRKRQDVSGENTAFRLIDTSEIDRDIVQFEGLTVAEENKIPGIVSRQILRPNKSNGDDDDDDDDSHDDDLRPKRKEKSISPETRDFNIWQSAVSHYLKAQQPRRVSRIEVIQNARRNGEQLVPLVDPRMDEMFKSVIDKCDVEVTEDGLMQWVV